MPNDDREKLSYSERDRLLRDRKAGHDQPRGREAQEAREHERKSALEGAEGLFGTERGGNRGDELAKVIHAAHGTPELGAACQAFVDEIGLPRSVDLLQIFIDTGQPELAVPALEALLELKQSGELELTPGLKSQLRTLAEDPDDDVAGISEELLA